MSVKLIGLTDGTEPLLVTVTVQSTDCGPLTAHTFVTLKSGAAVVPGGGTVIVVQMFVLLALLDSGCVITFPCTTVAQFVNAPPWGRVKEKRAYWDSPGARDVLAVQAIGEIGPAPGEQLMGNVPPAPV